MKIVCILLLLGSILIVRANDVTLSVCRDVDGLFHFSWDGDVLGWWFNNASSFDLQAKTTPDEGAEFVVLYPQGITESIFADPDAAPCIQDDTWKPGAPSIPIDLTTDCAFVYVQDEYGNWSQVMSDDVPVLLHYGQLLIGSADQSLDPTRYQAIPTECY